MKKKFLFVIIFAAFVLAGCNPTKSPEDAYVGMGGEPQAWIDAPLNESRLPLANYEIVFHITDSQQAMTGELSINGQVMASLTNPDLDDKLVTFKYLWSPTAPGEYTLQARAQNGEGVWGPMTESVVFIIEETPTPIVQLTPTLSPTNTITPTPTETLTPTLSNPQVNVDLDTNCRVGPGQIYDIVGNLLVGETGIVVGRTLDGNYWIINNPDGNGECWLWGNYATLEGPLDNLPYYTPPPTPTPTITPGFTNVTISPDLVYYGYCSPYEVLVSAEAIDPAGITAVLLYYRLKDENGNTTDWYSSAMDPQGGAYYAQTVNVDILAEETGFEESFGTFTLEVQLVIQNSFGQTTSSPVYGNVVVEYCRR